MKKDSVQVPALPPIKTEVASAIEMKMSKQDLIDMVIEERRSQLETELEDVTAVRDEARKEFELFKVSCKKLLEDAVKSTNKTLIASFKKAFPKHDERSEASFSAERYRESRFGKPLDANGEFRDEISFRVRYNIYARADGFASDNSLALSVDAKAFEEKVRPATVQYLNALDAAEKNVTRVTKEVAELSKRGNKVKAELTKRLLEQSEQGKALLAQIEGLKKSVKL